MRETRRYLDKHDGSVMMKTQDNYVSATHLVDWLINLEIRQNSKIQSRRHNLCVLMGSF